MAQCRIVVGVGREIILADPVMAICHSAAAADVLVVGSDEFDGLLPSSFAARVAVKLSERRRHGYVPPAIIIPTRPATTDRLAVPVGHAA